MRTPECGSVKCAKPSTRRRAASSGVPVGDGDPGRVELAGDGVHRGGVADLPADVGDILGLVVGRVDDEPVMALVHPQVQVVAVAVGGDLVPEHLLGILRPHVEILRADPDIGQLIDLVHAVLLLACSYPHRLPQRVAECLSVLRRRDVDERLGPLPQRLALESGDAVFGDHDVDHSARNGDGRGRVQAGHDPRLLPVLGSSTPAR